MMKVRLCKSVDVDFVHLMLQTTRARSFLRARASGTAGSMPKINQTDARAIPIPLPPLAEQKRIVAKVDQLMALCDELEAKQTRKRDVGDRLTKAALGALTSAEGHGDLQNAWKLVESQFYEFVSQPERMQGLRGVLLDLAIRGRLVRGDGTGDAGDILEQIVSERSRYKRRGNSRKTEPMPAIGKDPFRLPAGWRWSRLGDLCFQVADGPHFSPSYVAKEGGVPFLSARNIRQGGFNLDDVKYVSRADHQAFCERIEPEDGDILYTKGGTTGVAVVNRLGFEFSVWVHVAVLKIAKSLLVPEYVALALNSPYCYEQSQKYTHGTGNRDLGLTRMVLITVPLPPRSVQQQIVARVDQLLKLCDDLESKLRARDEKAAKLAAALVAEAIA